MQITEAAFTEGRTLFWGFELAVLACYLSAVTDNVDVALRMGGIAQRLYEETPPEERPGIQGLLEPFGYAAKILEIDRWPSVDR